MCRRWQSRGRDSTPASLFIEKSSPLIKSASVGLDAREKYIPNRDIFLLENALTLTVVDSSFSYPNGCSYCLMISIVSVRDVFSSNNGTLHLRATMWLRMVAQDLSFSILCPLLEGICPWAYHLRAAISPQLDLNTILGRKKKRDARRSISLSRKNTLCTNFLVYVSLTITE